MKFNANYNIYLNTNFITSFSIYLSINFINNVNTKLRIKFNMKGIINMSTNFKQQIKSNIDTNISPTSNTDSNTVNNTIKNTIPVEEGHKKFVLGRKSDDMGSKKAINVYFPQSVIDELDNIRKKTKNKDSNGKEISWSRNELITKMVVWCTNNLEILQEEEETPEEKALRLEKELAELKAKLENR